MNEDEKTIVELRGLPSPDNVARIRVIEPPQYGAATTTDDHGIAYTPPRDYSGSTWLGYEACWLDTGCAPGFVALTVLPINDLPATRTDVAQTDEDEPVSIDVLANDFDVEGSPLDLVVAWGATAGVTTIGDARVAWRPPDNFNGRATFLYAAADADGGTAVDRVTVDVAPVNDAPVIGADTAATDEDVPVKVELLENDSDPDGDKLEVLSTDPPTKGHVIHDATSATYVPPPDFAGAARFVYRVADGHGAAPSGTVDVKIAPVNDAPRPASDAASVDVDKSVEIAVLANDVDPEGEVLELVSVGRATSGSVAIDGDRVRFSAPAAPGTASFGYVVRDEQGATARGTVTVTVFGVNSAPSFVAGPDQNVGEDAGAQTVADWATAITPGRPDESAQTVSFVVSTGNPALFAPGGRPAVASDGTLTYTPAPDANGTSTITVRAQDNGGTAVGGVDTSPPQTRTITVAAVNDAPSVLAGASQNVLEDAGPQSVAGWATGISPGPADESGQTVSFLVTTPDSALFAAGGQPAVGTDGTLTYTPAANRFGVGTVTVRAHDSGGTAGGGADTGTPQTFTITITGVNDAPDAVDDTASVDEDDVDGVAFSVLANDTDPDADSLSVTAFDASAVTDGTLTSNGGGQFTFVPDAGFNGSQAFTYTVSDGQGGTDSAAVTVTVLAQPDSPTAADDAYATTQGNAVVEPAPGVLGNDGDEDGDPLTVQTTPIVAPASGTLALSSDGSFTYTPAPGFVGTDTFTYRVDDGTGRTDDAVVAITVAAVANTTTVFYLGTSGPSVDVWDLITAPPPAASPVPDFDGDGSPGLSIFRSNGAESVTDSERWQAWTRTVSLQPLVLNGPVVLQLWSTVKDFDPDDAAHPHVFLYDCLGGGVSCVKIAANHIQVADWNGGASSWVYHEFTVGSVSRTIPIGHELRIRLQTSQNDLWTAMTASYPSALVLTTAS